MEGVFPCQVFIMLDGCHPDQAEEMKTGKVCSCMVKAITDVRVCSEQESVIKEVKFSQSGQESLQSFCF